MKNSTSRRKFSKLLFSLPFFPVFGLTGCDAAGLSGKTSGNSASTQKVEGVSDSGKWLSGGTHKISVDYPGDDLFKSANPCRLSLNRETTLGPCYFEDDTGEDISLGHEGLPMLLCLRLIDSDCRPLENHEIEVWHCDTRGVYSGDTSESVDAGAFAGGFCTGGDDAAKNSSWYRGKLTTDSNGRVNFKTCFPGWYRGRTIHIHFLVRDQAGTSGLISQFCFTDELAREICTFHNLYSARGEQDTPLAGGRDTVFPSTGYEDFLLNTKQNPDGSLLAYQTIQIA